MKKIIEKLIAKLEELSIPIYDSDGEIENKVVFTNIAKNIVNELAEEYNNGWIPVSERLPSKEGEYLTFVEYDDDEFIAIDEFLCEGILKEWNCTPNYRVIAWMPLPKPYKEGEWGMKDGIHPQGYEIKRKQTNAGRIRSMTDEELAEFFSERDKIPNSYKCKEIDDWMKWLQSEVEGARG